MDCHHTHIKVIENRTNWCYKHFALDIFSKIMLKRKGIKWYWLWIKVSKSILYINYYINWQNYNILRLWRHSIKHVNLYQKRTVDTVSHLFLLKNHYSYGIRSNISELCSGYLTSQYRTRRTGIRNWTDGLWSTMGLTYASNCF